MNPYVSKRFLLLCVLLWVALVSPGRSEEQPQPQPQQQKQQKQKRNLKRKQEEQPQAQETAAKPADPPPPAIRLISPAENAMIVEKKPLIKCAIDVPYSSAGFVVMLDNADVTAVVNSTAEGFEYAPFLVIPPGPHNLSVSLLTKDGREVQQQFAFTTRHSETFTTAYSSNELTALVEDLLKKPSGATSIPESRVEGNLRSDNTLANENSTITFNTNLRYLNQSAPVFPPQKKGVIDAANWIMAGAYTRDKFKLDAAIGDITLEQTPYTLTNFARRGGKAGIDYDDRYHLGLFSVTGQQVFGFREGAGISTDTDDHILGVTASVKFLDKTVELKTVYINGGTQDNAFGTSSVNPAVQKGDVAGFVLSTDRFNGRFRTEIEADSSRYDPDVSDDLGAGDDRAWKVRAYGAMDRYTYEALYEHIGRDYSVVGSPGLPKDREGATARGGVNFDGQGLNVILSQYHDNVRNDELVPQIENGQRVLDYQYSKIPNLTLGLGYMQNRQSTMKAPEGMAPVETRLNGVTGRVGYQINPFNVSFQTGISRMDDLTDANRDSRNITYSLTPAYMSPALSVNPVLSFNEATDMTTGITTDTTTVNLDLRSLFLNKTTAFDLGGTYSLTKTDSGLSDMRTMNATFRLSYFIQNYFKDYVKPSIALRGTYAETADKIAGTRTKETTIYLVLAASVPFSF